MSGISLILYEGLVFSDEHGGGHLHFDAVAQELACREVPSTVVRPEAGVKRTRVSSSEVVIGLPAKGLLGALVYEAAKSVVLLVLALRHGLLRTGRDALFIARVGPSSLATAIARRLGFTVVLEVNGWVPEEMKLNNYGGLATAVADWTTRAQLFAAADIVTVSAGLKEHLARRTGLPSRTIANGADLARVSRLDCEPRGGQATGGTIVGYAGALTPWHPLEDVIEAIGELRIERPDLNLMVEVLGDGREFPRLQQRATEKPWCEFVRLRGWGDERAVQDLLHRSTVTVCPLRPKGPSGTCGSPLKLFESLAANRPVVATAVDGVTELSLPMLYTYSEGDLEAIKAALIRAIDEEPLDEDGLRRLREEISWSRRVDDLLKPYRLGAA